MEKRRVLLHILYLHIFFGVQNVCCLRHRYIDVSRLRKSIFRLQGEICGVFSTLYATRMLKRIYA